MSKSDLTLRKSHSLQYLGSNPVWSALFSRYVPPSEPYCWTVVIGENDGPQISVETALKMARHLLETDPKLDELHDIKPGTPWENVNRKYRTNQGLTVLEILIVIVIIAILGAMIIPELQRAKRRIKAREAAAAATNQEDRPNHLIYKTNYLIISGLEENSDTELPPNYAIMTNEWGGFVFKDGDNMIHPFWADGGWETEEKAIRAAWESHSRRLQERLGRLKPPNYTIIRTNQPSK